MITWQDLRCKCGCTPSADVLTNLLTLASKLNEIDREVEFDLESQKLVGKPIIVTCGHRCVPHNAAVGGAPDSQHIIGDAADIGCVDSETRSAIVSACYISAVPFIEVCPHHVHVDLRPGTRKLIIGVDA